MTGENQGPDLDQGPKMMGEESVTIRQTQAKRKRDHLSEDRGVLRRGGGVGADQKVSRDCLRRKARDGMTDREVERGEDQSPGAGRGGNPGLGAETGGHLDQAAETEEGKTGERRMIKRGLEMTRILRRRRRLHPPVRRKTFSPPKLEELTFLRPSSG